MKWFRFYHEALLDRKVQELSPVLFKHWVNLLCLASMSENEGELPDVKDMAYILRIKPSDCEAATGKLRANGLLDVAPSGRYVPHNWSERQRKSDSSAPRVAALRERQAAKQAGSRDLGNGQGNVTSNVTRNDISNTHVTPVTLLDERRVDEKREEEMIAASADGATSAPVAAEPSGDTQVKSSSKREKRYSGEEQAYVGAILKGIKVVNGTRGQLPTEGRERQAAHWFYRANDGQPVPVEEVLDLYRAVKTRSFWQGKYLSLQTLEAEYTEYRRDPKAYRAADKPKPERQWIKPTGTDGAPVFRKAEDLDPWLD